MDFRGLVSKRVWKITFWSEIGSGFGEPGGTPPPRIPGSTRRGVCNETFGWYQPPPQALSFSHRRGELETRVTCDEPQGTMGRVQTAVVSFPPCFARTFSSIERRLSTRQDFYLKVGDSAGD